MFSKLFLISLIIVLANCNDSVPEITTVLPTYNVDQIDDEGIINANPKAVEESIDEISVSDPKLNDVSLVSEAKEIKQFNIEMDRALEMTTIQPSKISEPSVIRIKRAPRYTIRQIIYPNGIMHEFGHLRDHMVLSNSQRVAKLNLPNFVVQRAASYSRRYRARTQYHHKNHHMPNHLSYLPVVGPIFDETRRKPVRL